MSMAINRPAGEVYEYIVQPANLPEWAAGLSAGIAHVEGQWVADSPMGRVVVAFAERNGFGVCDHDVTLPSGEVVSNPMRVITDGTGCEVVFSVRQRAGMSEADLARDAAAVAADLAKLKEKMERPGRRDVET